MNDYEELKRVIELLLEIGNARNRDRYIEWAKEGLKELGVNIDEVWNDEIETLLKNNPEDFLKTDVLKRVINTVYENSLEKEDFFKITPFSEGASHATIVFNAIADINRKKEYIREHSGWIKFWIDWDLFEDEEIRRYAFVESIKDSIDSIEYINKNNNYKNIELDLSEFEELYGSINERFNDYWSYEITEDRIDQIGNVYACISSKSKKEFLLSNISKLSFEDDYRDDNIIRIQISSIYNSLTEKEQEEIFNALPDVFSKSKLLYGAMRVEGEKFIDIIYNSLYDYENGNLDVETLKIKLAMHNLDLDAFMDKDFFSRINNKQDLLNSQEFSNLINAYYERLSDGEKRKFYNQLSFSRNLRRHITTYINDDYDLGEADFDFNLTILSKIQDENKKDLMGLDFKYGLLASGFINDPNEQLEVFIEMLESPNYYNYRERIITAIKKLDNLSCIELDVEEISNMLSSLYNECHRDYIENHIPMVMTKLISSASMKKYLETKPSEVYNMVGWYDLEFFKNLDVDEFYKTKLLLSSNAFFTNMADFFWQIEDEFLRTQILLTKHSEGIKSREEAEVSIARYEKIKQEFMNLPTSGEKTKYLLALHDGQTKEELDETYKDFNDIKKSLLKFIDNHEDRLMVIGSMKQHVQPEMEEYVELAKTMIEEFFEAHGGLNEDAYERMETVFNGIDMFLASGYSESGVTGEARHLYGDISVIKHRIYHPEKLLLDLIHEMSHSFSGSNYKSNALHIGNKLEEGMADIFTESVLNYYFEKHGSVEINGDEIEPQLPFTSTSDYYSQNAYIRTLLYPLAKKGEDVEAIKEFLLGDKSKFIELTLGAEFLQNCNKNCVGMPNNISINYRDIYLGNSEAFQIIDETSLYARKNYLLPAFQMQSKMDERRNRR